MFCLCFDKHAILHDFVRCSTGRAKQCHWTFVGVLKTHGARVVKMDTRSDSSSIGCNKKIKKKIQRFRNQSQFRFQLLFSSISD